MSSLKIIEFPSFSPLALAFGIICWIIALFWGIPGNGHLTSTEQLSYVVTSCLFAVLLSVSVWRNDPIISGFFVSLSLVLLSVLMLGGDVLRVSLFALFILIFGIVARQVVSIDERLSGIMLLSVCIGCSLVLSVAIAKYLFIPGFNPKFPAPFIHIRHYSNFACLSCLLLLIYFCKRRSLPRVFVALWLLCLLLILSYSGGRAAILGVLCSAFFMLLFTKTRRQGLIFGGAISLSILLVFLIPPSESYLGLRFSFNAEAIDLNQYSSNRIRIWESAMAYLAQQDGLIMGLGAGSIDQHSPLFLPDAPYTYVHLESWFFTLIFEFGLIGLAIFIVFNFVVLAGTVRRLSIGSLTSGACLIGYLVCGAFDGGMYYAYTVVGWAVLVLCCLLESKQV